LKRSRAYGLLKQARFEGIGIVGGEQWTYDSVAPAGVVASFYAVRID